MELTHEDKLVFNNDELERLDGTSQRSQEN